MKSILITGIGGLIGSETARLYAELDWKIVGIENNMRENLFGPNASTKPNVTNLLNSHPDILIFDQDIRDEKGIREIFKTHKFQAIVHTAAQPSHDWAAKDPLTDFDINARATLLLLKNAQEYCPEAPFLFTSTNKVYGDNPNRLPLQEETTRMEIEKNHPFWKNGIDESMSLEGCTHSLFGVSKTAADLLVQEYGRYYQLPTVCFRGGCLTGPTHKGTELHGFLSYLCKCIKTDTTYKIIGHQGKQVRDNIHSRDLVTAFYEFISSPKCGAVYNIGGGRENSCSVIEAIDLIAKLSGKNPKTQYLDTPRIGDHAWWITNTKKFRNDYPKWKLTTSLPQILQEILKSDH